VASRAQLFGDAFDDERHGKVGEALVAELLVAIDRSKHRTFADPGELKPVLKRTHPGKSRARCRTR
jgi:hypothetical protein